VEALSRFGTGAETRTVLEGLEQGKVDIVIATHRLLHSHARFHDLGLLIIDEEHRFGVRDKQRLQALRANVHVLTLTATPISCTTRCAPSARSRQNCSPSCRKRACASATGRCASASSSS